MTDLVEPSFSRTARNRTIAAAIAFGGAVGNGGWIQPSTSRLVEDPEGNLATGALNAFGESHSASSFDVTIDTGEALVEGAYMARDTTTTVTLASSTNNQTVYVGWADGKEDTVVVGKSGAFTSSDHKVEAWEFDTDGSGVTAATDKRNLDNFRVAAADVEQGSGSGLDADTVDGRQESTIPTSTDHRWTISSGSTASTVVHSGANYHAAISVSVDPSSYSSSNGDVKTENAGDLTGDAEVLWRLFTDASAGDRLLEVKNTATFGLGAEAGELIT